MADVNHSFVESVTPPITLVAYTSGDTFGSLMTIPVGSGRGVVGGTLRHLIIADDDNQKPTLKLYFYESEPTAQADNAAFAPTHADNKALLFTVDVEAADWETINSNGLGEVADINRTFKTDDGNLYCYAQITGAFTMLGVGAVTFKFEGWLD